jgi:isocitrate dehydrogenase kinase/phosphatase
VARAPDDEPISQGAEIIAETFDRFFQHQREIVRCACANFERQDWQATQRDSAARLDLYNESVREGLDLLHGLLGPRFADSDTWLELRNAYAERVAVRGDREVAETYFNSFTRRIFHTVGVNAAMEFVSPPTEYSDLPLAPAGADDPKLVARFERNGSMAELFASVLAHYEFRVPWDDAPGDAERVAEEVTRGLGTLQPKDVRALELAQPVFFRGKGAYLVGQILTTAEPLPLVLALTNPDGRIVVDAALVSRDEVSIVFSFARAYFFVDVDRPHELVEFLRAIMPHKPVAELYNAIGWNKHGKTELYRSILHHLATSDDRFEIAPGQRGMVMSVFTLPGFDVVFKVMRDRFEPPKTVTPDEVRRKYRMVFRHDRAGRLVDAQEFEHVEFDRARFDPALLAELVSACSERVRIEGDQVVLSHLYTERRLRPLDVYLREAPPGAAREAVIDYGQVMRDLAATNIFPGDMLTKNFGVSRNGRLIFYDYDELCRLDECRFRGLPPPRNDDDETSGEPWFYVSEKDIFPEEFRNFLGLPPVLLEAFLEHHAELLGPAFWLRMQELHARGEVLDVYPYRSARRLRWRARSGERRPDPMLPRS